MKLVGGDSGRVEHEEFVDRRRAGSVERVVVDVLVGPDVELALERHTPDRTYRLAAITVTEGAPSTAATRFAQLRRAAELEAKRAQLEPWLSRRSGQDPGTGRPDGRPSCYAARRWVGHLYLSDASLCQGRSPAAAPSAA